MNYVAPRISESSKQDLLIISSEDNSEKLIVRCRVLGGADKDEEGGPVEEDLFLRQLEHTMLNSISLRGVKNVDRVFLHKADVVVTTPEGNLVTAKEKEWVLERDGVNLKTVPCIDGVDSERTYSNSCIETFNVLGIEAACAAILKELCGVIEFDGSYVSYRHLALLCDLMTHRGALMSLTRHGYRGPYAVCLQGNRRNHVGSCYKREGRLSWYRRECHVWAVGLMGTGAFDVALDVDMLEDAVVDHQLPVAEHDGSSARRRNDTGTSSDNAL